MTVDATAKAIAELLDVGEVRLDRIGDRLKVMIVLRNDQAFVADHYFAPMELDLSVSDVIAFRVGEMLVDAARNRDVILARRPKL